MRNLVSVSIAFACALSLALAAPVMAGEQVAPIAPAKAQKVHQLTGFVEAVDAAAGTFTVKGRRISVSLRAGDKVSLETIAVGEKVYVRYADGTALSVKIVHARMRKAMKKPDPAAPANPAVPAAPAEKR